LVASDEPEIPGLGLSATESAAPASEFVALFLAHQWRIHRYIVALLASHQDAEDLLQETAALLWRKFADFQPGTSFLAWSYKTAYLLVLEHRRRKNREAAPLALEVLEQLASFSTQEDSSLEIRLSALHQCLEKLTSKDRALVEHCYSTDAKVKDVAAGYGRSAKSVRKSLGRIRRMLIGCIRRTVSVAAREGA
jgi:RNA polymerase sigma-70 factor (ECF subfamily)